MGARKLLEYSRDDAQTRGSQKYFTTVNPKGVLAYSWFCSFFGDFRYYSRKAPGSPDQTTLRLNAEVGFYAVRAPLLLETGGFSVIVPDSQTSGRHPADRFQCLLELLNLQLVIQCDLPPSFSRGKDSKSTV